MAGLTGSRWERVRCLKMCQPASGGLMSLTLLLCATRLIKIALMRIAFCSGSVPPVLDGVTRTSAERVSTLTEAHVDSHFLSGLPPAPRPPVRDRSDVVRPLPCPLVPY